MLTVGYVLNAWSYFQNTAPAQFIPSKAEQLLSRVSGHGLLVTYRFTRSPSLFSSKMCSIELQFSNQSDKPIANIRLGEKVSASLFGLFMTVVSRKREGWVVPKTMFLEKR